MMDCGASSGAPFPIQEREKVNNYVEIESGVGTVDIIFQTENVMFNEQTFDKADLSQETLEWLEWYNGLTEAEQLAVDYIPADLCGNINAEGLTSETK